MINARSCSSNYSDDFIYRTKAKERNRVNESGLRQKQ